MVEEYIQLGFRVDLKDTWVVDFYIKVKADGNQSVN